MCGIVYMEDFLGRPVNRGILKQYEAQKQRGTEGFGLFDGKMMNIVKATREKKIKRWLKRYQSNLIMFHHRYPTSTANVKRAAHPFSTGEYFGDTTYVLVHNGVIRNAEDLFCDHQELGIQYKTLLEDLSFNDSEALLWDFALYIEGKQKQPKALGDMAFICLKLVGDTLERMYFYSNGGRPLNMLKSTEGLMLSSEGEGDRIKWNTLYNWNYKLKRLYTRSLSILEREPYVSTYQPELMRNYPYSSWDDDYDFEGNPGGSFNPQNGRWEPFVQSTKPSRTFTAGSYADKASRDDDQAYIDWWNSQDAKKAGDWLGDHLRNKFKQFFDDDGKVVGFQPKLPAVSTVPVKKDNATLDFGSKGGILVPTNEKQMYEKRFVAEKKAYPTLDEINETALNYLASVDGNFEMAYASIEGDYSRLEGKPQTENVIRAKVLLDLVLQQLDDDPEYINAESVSSMWRSVWMQSQFAKK